MIFLVAGSAFIGISVVAATVLAFIFGGLNSTIAWVSGAAGFVAALQLGRSLVPKARSPLVDWRRFDVWEWATVGFFVLVCLRAFGWLVFRSGNSLSVLSANNYGDMPLHIQYIQFLVNGVHFWPENPIFSGNSLNYPIGVDLFNSLLVLTGFDLLRGLVLVGFLGAALTGVALLLWGGVFTLAGFLFSGGFWGFMVFKTGLFLDYQKDVAWKNLFLAVFVTQRGYLYALPVGLLLLSVWFGKIKIPRWLEIFFYCTMPLFHMHTFIFLSILLLVLIFVRRKRAQRDLLWTLLCSLVPATILVAFLTSFFRAGSMIHTKWGWMQGRETFLVFWLMNFGLFIPLAFWCLIDIFKSGDWKKDQAVPAFVGIGGFLVFTYVMLSPWEWDNTKILLWFYLLVFPLLWSRLVSKWTLPCQWVACAALFTSGFVSVVGGIGNQQRGHEIFKFDEIWDVQSAVRNLPVEERFAAAPTFNHPLAFSGRKLVLGYAGHLWSYGLHSDDKLRELRNLMNGGEGWSESAKALKVRYLFWGAKEKSEFNVSLRPWEKKSRLVASGGWGSIFDLEEKP